MVKVVTPAASSPIHQCIGMQRSALHCAKNQGREFIGVGPVSRSMAPWMRTGTSLCTDLSPSSLDVETY